MRRVLRDVAPDLLQVFFVALLDFLAKELPQRAIAKAFIALLRMIRHQIGDQCPGEPPRALYRIGTQEGINGTLPGGGCRRRR